MASKFVILLLPFYFLFQTVSSKYVEGEISTDTSKTKDVWRFVARFCFISGGEFEYEFEYPEKYEKQSLYLYYDEPDKWPDVYNSNKDCIKRTGLPYINETAGHRIRLGEFDVGCKMKGNTIKCDGGRGLVSARQRWWYLAVARCDPDVVRENVKGLQLKYKLTMTNGNSLFFKHFSADEFYILQMDITFLLVTLVILVVTVVFMVLLAKKQLLHTTFKMFFTSLVFHFLYLFFMCINYGTYANDGIERSSFKTFGRLWEVASDLTFVLMLILMAKGYTITRGKLRKTSWIKICVFTVIYVVAYIILFILEAELHDPAEVIYVYDSAAGIGLIVLRLCAWCWFLYANIFTMKHYPEKRKFYIPFLIFFTVWFLATPIVILIARFALSDWVRATVVNSIEVFIALCGQIFFLVLTAPSSANKNFPFHVKTTKIGTMLHAPHHDEDHCPISDDDESDTSSPQRQNGFPLSTSGLERYSHGRTTGSAPYSVPNAAPNFLDLFVTSQTYSANPRPLSPPPYYTPSHQGANGDAGNAHEPPPAYAPEEKQSSNNTERLVDEQEEGERTIYSNDDNPFITQR